MRFIKKLFSVVTFRRFKLLLLGSLAFVFLGVLGFLLWWNFIFFPDDYDLTRNLAKIKSTSTGSYVKRADLLLNVQRASLSGFPGAKKIEEIVKAYKKKKFLIKKEDYVHGRGSDYVFRAGTGHVGIWVDERSAMLIPPGAKVKFSLEPMKEGLIEFATLAKGGGGKLKVSLKSGNRALATKVLTVKGYENLYSNSDVKIKFSNIGFEKSRDYTGWNGESLNFKRGNQNRGKLILEMETLQGSEPLFVANMDVLERQKRKGYNLVYVLFDGVAPQFWSFHNEKSNLTPFLGKVAKKDYIVFDHMITMGNKTRISLSGMFTSSLPHTTRHGINRNYIPPEEREIFYRYVQKGEFETFPSYMRKNGYVAAQFGNSGFTVDLLGTGTDYGFERSYEFQYNPYDSLGISRHFFKFVRENRNRNFYAYCHYNTPHKPYYAPLKYFFRGPFNAPLRGLWRLIFSGTVHFTDDVYKNIHLMLKENGLWDNTIVVVATDHGSGFPMSKFGRGLQFNEYSRQIFILHLPNELKKKLGAPGGHRKTFVSSINISPTLLDLLGLKIPKQFNGRSIVSIINGKYNKAMWDKEIWCLGRKTCSLFTPDLMKYIVTGTDTKNYIGKKYYVFGEGKEMPYEMLFNLKDDPGENKNLIHEDLTNLKRMRALFLKGDIHHPEKTLVTLVPGNKDKRKIKIKIQSGSPIIRAELYDKNMKLIKSFEAGKKDESYDFVLAGDPCIFVFEQLKDRANLRIDLLSNGKMIPSSAIHSTALDLSLLKNPVIMKSIDDFRIHYVKKPALLSGWKGVPGDDLSVKISRMDLHRWIDINRYEQTRISASMKETLKSWGYIQ